MPHVENNGVKIHYLVEGAGAALVVQHVFTRRVETVRALGHPKGLGEGRGDRV